MSSFMIYEFIYINLHKKNPTFISGSSYIFPLLLWDDLCHQSSAGANLEATAREDLGICGDPGRKNAVLLGKKGLV